MSSADPRLPALRGLLAVWALAAPFATSAVDTPAANIKLTTAWMRPAAAGMAEAQVYVDIVSETDLTLVGATTPVAKKVELVEIVLNADPPEPKVVTSMSVPGGKMTRLAYRGSHLRLVEINKDLANGTAVPVALAFKSADGKEVIAKFDAQVRGLLLPRQMPAVITPPVEPAAKESDPAMKETRPAPMK